MSDLSSLNKSILELSSDEALALIAGSRSRRRRPTKSSIKSKARAAKKPAVKRSPKQTVDSLMGKMTKEQKLKLLKELGG